MVQSDPGSAWLWAVRERWQRLRDGVRALPTPLLVVVGGLVAGTAIALGTSFLLGGGTVLGPSPAPEVLPLAVRITTTTTPPPPATVHVAGAVSSPGVVALPDGSRIVDALAAAGGARPDADLARLNLAEPVLDGSRIYVAAFGEEPPPALSPTGPGGGSAAAGGGSGPGGSVPGAPLDLNRATAEELDTLPGVGPSTAAAIVAHREANGPFATVDDLLAVRGIGPAKLEALRAAVTV